MSHRHPRDRSTGIHARRREIIGVIGAAAVCLSRIGIARGAPSKIYRVATLTPGVAVTASSPLGIALVRGLAQHGYVVDRNYTLLPLAAEFNPERLRALADQLAASEVDVVVAFGYPASAAVKERTILPEVSVTAGDPVGTGLVASLARPGGHVTGISDVSSEMTPKRMEFLGELAPGLKRVAVLWNAADPGMTLRYRACEEGAKAMGISIQPLGVREPDDFAQAFAAMTGDLPDAILMVSDPLTILNRRRVFEFAAAHHLPAIYENDTYVRDGGLMSYGPDTNETYERVAALVDRILKGAKPADLPFERPTLFRFVINLATARSLGIAVPPLLIARADEVVE